MKQNANKGDKNGSTTRIMLANGRPHLVFFLWYVVLEEDWEISERADGQLANACGQVANNGSGVLHAAAPCLHKLFVPRVTV